MSWLHIERTKLSLFGNGNEPNSLSPTSLRKKREMETNSKCIKSSVSNVLVGRPRFQAECYGRCPKWKWIKVNCCIAFTDFILHSSSTMMMMMMSWMVCVESFSVGRLGLVETGVVILGVQLHFTRILSCFDSALVHWDLSLSLSFSYSLFTHIWSQSESYKFNLHTRASISHFVPSATRCLKRSRNHVRM